MTDNQNIFKRTKEYIGRSITLKLISIGILILLMLIPTAMVESLIKERGFRRDSVVREISKKWGDSQTIAGPFITIPYKTFQQDDAGKKQLTLDYLHVLPETLDITGKITPEVRYRSLFEVVLYNIKLKFRGNFKLPQTSRLNVDPNFILWDKAHLSLGVSDMRGIQDNVGISFNNSIYQTNPGLRTTDIASAGVSTQIESLSPNQSYAFSFDLDLNGSEQVSFIPAGESNTVMIKSDWPSPSFNGAFLPISREVNKDGFSASWKVLHLNRNYPQFWEGNRFYPNKNNPQPWGDNQESRYNIGESAFGVKLILTADIYQKSTRLAKYSVMFLVLTFAAFFFSEIITKQRVHPIQYLLIGLAILLFYTLVLSLSEHMHFNLAYFVAAASITFLISGYAKAILSSSKFALTIFGILAVLYCYLFIVLQLEDYALLLGSTGLLFILAIVMYATRNFNWYEIESTKQQR